MAAFLLASQLSLVSIGDRPTEQGCKQIVVAREFQIYSSRNGKCIWVSEKTTKVSF